MNSIQAMGVPKTTNPVSVQELLLRMKTWKNPQTFLHDCEMGLWGKWGWHSSDCKYIQITWIFAYVEMLFKMDSSDRSDSRSHKWMKTKETLSRIAYAFIVFYVPRPKCIFSCPQTKRACSLEKESSRLTAYFEAKEQSCYKKLNWKVERSL